MPLFLYAAEIIMFTDMNHFHLHWASTAQGHHFSEIIMCYRPEAHSLYLSPHLIPLTLKWTIMILILHWRGLLLRDLYNLPMITGKIWKMETKVKICESVWQVLCNDFFDGQKGIENKEFRIRKAACFFIYKNNCIMLIHQSCTYT
jgi:hypothetical protein